MDFNQVIIHLGFDIDNIQTGELLGGLQNKGFTHHEKYRQCNMFALKVRK